MGGPISGGEQIVPIGSVKPIDPTGVVTGKATNNGIGVLGRSNGAGVEGDSTSRQGVVGTSVSYRGVEGSSQTGYGVWAYAERGVGLHAAGEKLAAEFQGVVQVNGDQHVGGAFLVHGDITASQNALVSGTLTAYDVVLLGADCAEEFDVAALDEAEPGTVMTLNEQGPLQPSQQAYDKKVVGVISGAGEYQPGLILDRKGAAGRRLPIALVGKVYCKVDAQYASIEVGDLLTTSPTPGHAMKAEDPVRAFGSVIGKALRPLQAGQGLIPVLIALQ